MPKKGSRLKAAPKESINDSFTEVGKHNLQLDALEQQQPMPSAVNHSLDTHEHLRTPVRHRAKASAGDSKWDPALAHQFQTPERHRSDLASLVLSPQGNHFGSPGVGLASPNLVPLFQPSPRRALLSPHQHSGVNSFGNIFQSPVRAGDFQGSEFLRYETPSSKPRFSGLLSPSPVRGKRQTPGGQHRQRAVSLEARGWQLGGPPGAAAEGFSDVQHLMHGTEDEQEDLIKDILQSPGPKELQQAADRIHTRSRSSLAPAADTTAAAAADLIRRPQHPHRRALDFSKADTVHQDFQSLAGKRLTRHSSSHAGSLAAAAAAVAGSQGQQQQQTQLPLIPLDLSECEKHNPGSPFKQLTSTGITPRRSSRRQQQQQQSALDAVLTSPRSALDAAMAHITQSAIPALLQTSSLDTMQGLEGLEFNPDSVGAFKALQTSAVRPAFEELTKEAATGGGSSAAAAAAGVSAMVPLGSSAAAAADDSSSQERQQQLEAFQQEYEQYQQQMQAYGHEQAMQRDIYSEAADMHDAYTQHQQQQQQRGRQQRRYEAEDSDSDYEEEQQPAAAAPSRRGAGSTRWNLRPHGKKQYSSGIEMQPSRRSRRIAGDTPDEVTDQQQQQQEEKRSTPGSSGRSKRQQSRIGALLKQEQQQHEDSQASEVAQQQQQEEEDVTGEAAEDQQLQNADPEAGAAVEEAAEAEESERPRSRSGSRRGSSSQKTRKSSRRSSKMITDDSGMDTEAADAEAAAAAAAALYGLPPVSGLQQLLQSGGLIQLPNGMTVPIGMTPSKGGIGGLMGPNTPDEVRMAHMTQSYGLPVRSCHCKKSQCLKLYCDCFANNVFCNGCSCNDCRNVESNHTEVLAKRTHIQQRDPTAFIAKLAATDADTLANRKGCKCKKSHCLKKYCECFQMGVRCADVCKCTDCRNIEDGSGSLNKKLLPRTLHAAAAAAVQPGSAGRLQHQQQQQFWSMAAGAAPASSAALGLGSVLLRMPGGPNTPGSSGLMCLPLQSPADQAAAAAALLQCSSAPPAAAVAAASNLNRIAKPLLPQFLQAAAAAATPAAVGAGIKIEVASQDPSAAAAAEDDGCLFSDEELPTPEQQAALEHAAALAAAAANDHHHTLASPASSSGAHSSRGRSPARALNLDRMASQDGSVLRSNSLSSPIPALQALTAAAAAAGIGLSPVIRQQSPAAAGSSSAGGGLHGSPKPQYGLGSGNSNRAKHRLASTSRAIDDEQQPAYLLKQQQQPQQQQGILALVGAGTAAAAGPSAAAAAPQQQQHQAGVATRRQLLQHIKEEPESAAVDLQESSHWARPAGKTLQPQSLFAAAAAMAPPASHWQRSTPAAAGQFTTPEKASVPAAAEAADGQDNAIDTSPVQPIVLGPNGPTVVLSQRQLSNAMSQTLAAYSSSTAGAAANGGADDSSQAVGMLMTVVDENGQVQYYFLPSTQGTAAAGAAAAATTSTPQQQQQVEDLASKENHQQQLKEEEEGQQSHCQLRRRAANPMQGTGLSHLPDDMIIDQPSKQQQQQPVASAAAVTPTKQQRPTSPSGRCLRSCSSAMNGSSPARTPSKRATPVKRKADADVDQDTAAAAAAAAGSSPFRLQPSPAKLRHKLDFDDHDDDQQQQQQQEDAQSCPPQQQQQLPAARQVILSPVKQTKGGGLVVLPPQQQQRHEQLQDFGQQLSSQEANNTVAAAAAAGVVMSPLQGIPISPAQLAAPAAAAAHVQVHPLLDSDTAGFANHQLFQQQQQQQGMQLFVAKTAEGQQYLLQAPVGTDPAKLMQLDVSVNGFCLGALGSSTAAGGVAGCTGLAPQQQQQQSGFAGNYTLQPVPMQTQQQQQQQGFAGLQRQGSTTSGSFSGDATAAAAAAAPGSRSSRRPREFASMSPQPKVLLSPRDTRTRDGSLFKFSPGCTTVFSPTKPSLGHSPGRSGSH